MHGLPADSAAGDSSDYRTTDADAHTEPDRDQLNDRIKRPYSRVMKQLPPPLAPFLRSNTQGEVLALLLLDAQSEHSIAEVTRAVRAPHAVVHKEVDRLVDAGILTDTRRGRARLVRANLDYRLLRPLTEIVAGTYGPVPTLAELLRAIPGVDQAYIYGSWAARYTGDPGPAPADVDVLVVGDAQRSDLNEAAATAEERLRVPVNVTRVSSSAWDAQSDPFLTTVRSRPLVRLDVPGEPAA